MRVAKRGMAAKVKTQYHMRYLLLRFSLKLIHSSYDRSINMDEGESLVFEECRKFAFEWMVQVVTSLKFGSTRLNTVQTFKEYLCEM